MKNILLFLALATSVVLTSCKGDPGPPGKDGGLLYAQVYETTVRNFQYDPNVNQLYSNVYSFPFTVYESDAVLAYRLSGSDNTVNPPADVWTQLPQSVFYNDGTGDFFQYNFNFSFTSVQYTIEGNFPLTNIDQGDSSNQTFRIVVVPSEFAETNPSMDDIIELMYRTDGEIQNLEKIK